MLKTLWNYIPPEEPFIPEKEPPKVSPTETPERFTGVLETDLALMRTIFHSPMNKDLVLRPIRAGGVDCALLFLEGMCDSKILDEAILRPLTLAGMLYTVEPAARSATLLHEVLQVCEGKQEEAPQKVTDALLTGKSALLVDGDNKCILMDTRGYPKRSVERPQTEDSVVASHEGFNENMRTNISLLRKIMKSEHLITEILEVGEESATSVALCYRIDIINPSVVAQIKTRIANIHTPMLSGTGQLQQWIEDNPYSLIPQTLMTERPDRAASFLLEGQAVLLVDGTPYALAAPCTIFHFFHTPEDTFIRWQYGSFSRVIRFLGLLIAVFLPGLYIAIVLYDQQMLPISLLTTIAQSRVQMPFSLYIELLIVHIVFDIIQEASVRLPGPMSGSLGIIGGLVLGQAIVDANLVSPLVVIIVASVGLGSFTISNYALSMCVRILRIGITFVAAAGGLGGLALAGFSLLIYLSSLSSFGIPFLSPASPKHRSNPDIILRLPIWKQGWRPGYIRPREEKGK